jgi:hypothetical protein
VVPDSIVPERPGSKDVQTHAYTLHGLLDALDDARLRSYGANPVVAVVLENRTSRVIRRYEHGHEVPSGGSRGRSFRRSGVRAGETVGKPALSLRNRGSIPDANLERSGTV